MMEVHISECLKCITISILLVFTVYKNQRYIVFSFPFSLFVKYQLFVSKVCYEAQNPYYYRTCPKLELANWGNRVNIKDKDMDKQRPTLSQNIYWNYMHYKY